MNNTIILFELLSNLYTKQVGKISSFYYLASLRKKINNKFKYYS